MFIIYTLHTAKRIIPYKPLKMTKKNSPNQVPDWLMDARDKWQYTGQTRPPFADRPGPGQRSVWDFPRPPALVPLAKEVEIQADGVQIALTSKALELQETASPPTVYLPPEDVVLDLLLPLPKRSSLCEWKGKAVYWALKAAPDKAIAWSYANPFAEYAILKDYLAFYPQYLECFVNSERVIPQPGDFYAGWITNDLCGPFKGAPGSGHW